MWGPEQQECWESLKKAITTPPVLAYPRVGWPYRLHTDAAKTGMAYMLTQVKPEEEWKQGHPDEHDVPTVRKTNILRISWNERSSMELYSDRDGNDGCCKGSKAK